MLPIAAVVTDIEGTTTPISFVRDTLFPFARARLPDLVGKRGREPAIAAELEEVRRMTPGAEPLETLLHWMDIDAKLTPLKALQGVIWRQGYVEGALQGAVYPEVPDVLRRWKTAGLRLFVYSSGSVDAQKLLFSHSVAGDLTPLFDGFFDTRIGPKREPESYGRLAIGLGLPTPEVLFLSDVEEELDAAAAAGLRTCQLVRPDDATLPSERHATAVDFDEVAAALA